MAGGGYTVYHNLIIFTGTDRVQTVRGKWITGLKSTHILLIRKHKYFHTCICVSGDSHADFVTLASAISSLDCTSVKAVRHMLNFLLIMLFYSFAKIFSELVFGHASLTLLSFRSNCANAF